MICLYTECAWGGCASYWKLKKKTSPCRNECVNVSVHEAAASFWDFTHGDQIQKYLINFDLSASGDFTLF